MFPFQSLLKSSSTHLLLPIGGKQVVLMLYVQCDFPPLSLQGYRALHEVAVGGHYEAACLLLNAGAMVRPESVSELGFLLFS